MIYHDQAILWSKAVGKSDHNAKWPWWTMLAISYWFLWIPKWPNDLQVSELWSTVAGGLEHEFLWLSIQLGMS